MQTFLPYPDLKLSFECLDMKRLGNQRNEAKILYNAVTGVSKAWNKHPAALMWQGFEDGLALYHNTCIQSWIDRGYKNSIQMLPIKGEPSMPKWFGRPSFHSAHRSNLLRKKPDWYKQFGWTESDDLEYEWN